jgi:hypothetical protein
MTLSVISTPRSPSGSRNRYIWSWICSWIPKPLSTEKLKANNGTIDSSVV